jgi:transcriptional regulator with XRE-family HTH domain
MPKDELGRLLRQLRKAARVTEAEMAVEQDVTVKTIQNWERGHTKPRLGDVRIYEGRCGRTVLDLRDEGEAHSPCEPAAWFVRPNPNRRRTRRQSRRRPEILLSSSIQTGSLDLSRKAA